MWSAESAVGDEIPDVLAGVLDWHAELYPRVVAEVLAYDALNDQLTPPRPAVSARTKNAAVATRGGPVRARLRRPAPGANR
jgi:hypothetical protein